MKARGENSKLPGVRASSNEGRLEQMHQAALLLLLLETDKSEVNWSPRSPLQRALSVSPRSDVASLESISVDHCLSCCSFVTAAETTERAARRENLRRLRFVRSFLALPPSLPRLLLLKQDKVR